MYQAGSFQGPEVVYALDDAYIHMAMAQNLDEQGGYGVNSNRFASASSSPLWPFLLVLMRWVVSPDLGPLLLNCVALFFLIYFAYRLLTLLALSADIPVALALLFLVFALPVPALIAGGMEHLLHASSVLGLVYYALRLDGSLLERNGGSRPGVGGALYSLAFLACALRYESVIVVGLLAVLLFLRGYRNEVITLLVFGMTPLAAFGVYLFLKSGLVIPFSVVSKSSEAIHSYSGEPSAIPEVILLHVQKILNYREMPVEYVSIVALIAAFVLHPLSSRHRLSGSAAVLALLLGGVQFSLGKFGWLYRYEAYLFSVALVAFLATGYHLLHDLSGQRRKFAVGLCILLLLTAPLMLRGIRGGTRTYQAIQDRTVEHFVLADIIGSYPDANRVIAGDIGVLAYYQSVDILDVFGLANRDSAEFRRNKGKLDPDFLLGWTAGYSPDFAVLRRSWVEDFPEQAWYYSGDYTIQRNVVFQDTDPIFFLAFDRSSAEQLRKHLLEFRNQVPEGALLRIPERAVLWDKVLMESRTLNFPYIPGPEEPESGPG